MTHYKKNKIIYMSTENFIKLMSSEKYRIFLLLVVGFD